MRAGLLTILLLTPMLAVAAPKPYRAEYEVRHNGSAEAVTTVSYSAQAGGRWQFSSHTRGTQGLAALVGGARDENSILRWNGDRPEMINYSFSQKAAWSSKQRSATVDAARGRITGVDKDQSYSLAYQAGVLDVNSINVGLINDLAAGKRGDLVYTVVNKHALETQRYRVVGAVDLPTALGNQHAIKVERVRDNGDGRSTTLWFGVDQGFIPLRMEQREPNGDSIDMRISHLGA
jgi:hypothetical protein